MTNHRQASTNWHRCGAAFLAFGTLLSAPAVNALPSERAVICKGAPPARQDELIVVDSDFRRLPDNSIHLGTIDLSATRHIDGAFFIVAPLRVDPATDLQGSDLHAAIDKVAECADKNVFTLNFTFDGSTLPAGAFSKPLAVFKGPSASDGEPLKASIEAVTGTIRRFWISTDLVPATGSRAGALDLRLTNKGDLDSQPLMFDALDEKMAIFHVGANHCQAQVLAVGQSCIVEMERPRGDEKGGQFEWPIGVGPHSGVKLEFTRAGHLSVEALNQ
jgi:hypothetical protein